MASLLIAIEERERVVVYLEGDGTAGKPMRTIEGTPIEIVSAADGRERIVFVITEGTEQYVLLERIARIGHIPRE